MYLKIFLVSLVLAAASAQSQAQAYGSSQAYQSNPIYQSNQGYQSNQNYQSNQGYQSNQNYQSNQGYQSNPNYQTNQGYPVNQGYQSNQGYQRYQNNQGYTNNQASTVYRPCPNFDTSCIGQWLARNSYCRIATGPVNVDQAFHFSAARYEFPVVNTTLLRRNITHYGILDGIIDEFFVDYTNGYTVLAVHYYNFYTTVGEARFELNRRANIPAVEITPEKLTDPEFTITTVFPATSGLDLANSRSSGFFHRLPNIQPQTVGPIVQNYLDHLSVTNAEIYITPSPYINRQYIQNILCDFGVRQNKDIVE